MILVKKFFLPTQSLFVPVKALIKCQILISDIYARSMERSVYVSALIVMRFDVLRTFRRADLKLSRHLLIYNLPVIDMLSLMKDRRKANVTKINRSIDRSKMLKLIRKIVLALI